MTDRDMETLREAGLAPTVGEILGDRPGLYSEVEDALVMPRLPTTDPEPALGIHFGIEEEAYHRLPCFSNSLLRKLLASPTLMWANSYLNPEREEKDAEHFRIGKAYHAMILEGHDAYTKRFYPLPDPKDYPKALQTADEVKNALKARDLKPVTRVDVEGGKDGETRAAVKADHVAQLMAADRTALVWDHIVGQAERYAGGRTLIKSDDDLRIRMCARMIQQDPELAKAFKGGYPEVTLIWRDPRQGVLMKARIDYLKLKAIVDLKTYANVKELSARKAIARTIGEKAYALQPAVYCQGADEVRNIVRAHGASAIHFHDGWTEEQRSDATAWALKWATWTEPDRFLWLFQAKGSAPVTRAFYHPLSGTLHSIAQSMFTEGVRKFRECADIFGSDVPWLDLGEIDDLEEGEIPLFGLEI